MNEPTTPAKRRYRSLFPKTLGACVEPLTRPVFKAQGLAGSRLIMDWEKIVGHDLAARCVPQKLTFQKGKTTDGTLVIALENGFATELQYRQIAILERLAAYFGYKAVARITICHSGLPPAKITAAAKAKKPALPTSCLAAAESVEDEELKSALASLAHTLST